MLNIIQIRQIPLAPLRDFHRSDGQQNNVLWTAFLKTAFLHLKLNIFRRSREAEEQPATPPEGEK